MPNPRTKEFPLRHQFGIAYSLQNETGTDPRQTAWPLFFADQAKNEALAQGIQVNPQNDAFEDVVVTPACFMNSRVNKIKITEYCRIPTIYDLPDIIYYKAIVTWGLGDYQIKDAQGTTLLTEMGYEQAADSIHPAYNGTKVSNDGFLHPDVDGLTVNQGIEATPDNVTTLFKIRHGSMGGKIRSMMAGPFANRVHKDYPYFSERWFTVPGNVKRMNSFTGCFMHTLLSIHKTQAATAQDNTYGVTFDGETTVDEDALHLFYNVEFNEYNDSFDQVA